MVSALAGTGKTFTLVGGVQALYGKSLDTMPSRQQTAIWKAVKEQFCPDSVCFTTFTVSAKDEIKRRITPSLCTTTTLSAMGYQAIKCEVGITGEIPKVNKWKTDRLVEIVHNGTSVHILKKTLPGYPTAVKRLVQLAKYSLLTTPDDDILESLAGQYGVILGENAKRIFDTVRKVLILACKDCLSIDFDDMLWLPLVLNIPIKRYDLLIVDEGQDLNHCQQELALRASNNLFIAGDAHQAIYGFAGADTKSMTTMYHKLWDREGCENFPLTVTYRCSQAVTREAQFIVPALEAHHSNVEGSIGLEDNCDTVAPLDMILCRVNAPLIGEAFKLIMRGIPAMVLGKGGIDSGLKRLIEILKPDSLPDLKIKIGRYNAKETTRICNSKGGTTGIIALNDKCSCLHSLCQHATSVDEVIKNIDELFANKNDAVTLSSIHRAKGLEANNVFIIRPDLLPHPLAKTDWEREQERNLQYVAITRARHTLTYVE